MGQCEKPQKAAANSQLQVRSSRSEARILYINLRTIENRHVTRVF